MKSPPNLCEIDCAQPFIVKRVDFLRSHTPGRLRRMLQDLVFTRTKVAVEILKLLRELKPDMVCIGSLHDGYWLARVVKIWRNLPIIFYVHGEEISGLYKSRLHGKGPLRALQNADVVVCVSSFTRGLLVGHGVDPAKIRIIHNGVDLKKFTPGPKDRELIARYRLQNKRILLTLGRLDKRKGQDIAVRAMPQVLETFPDTVYIIVGDGDQRLSLEMLVLELHLSGKVFFCGAVPEDELVRWYRTCDVFLMPNRTLPSGDTEGFGIVFLEAGACAKPVIGGAAGGVPDAIEDEVAGVLVEGTSVDAVANAVIRILSDPDMAASLGANGLRKAQENSWQSKATQFRALCLDLLNCRN